MKKSLLLVFLLFLGVSFAQYEPVLKPSSHWIELKVMLTPEFINCQIDSIVYINDTNINGNQYHVLNNFSDFNNHTNFIREDTTNGRLWFFASIPPYNGNVNEETLIMDLSLNLGDAFPIPIRSIQNEQIIDTFNVVVDSIFYQNNKKHIRFGNLINDFTHEHLTFIEGIGTNFGFDYTYNTKNKTLVKHVKSDSLNYFQDFTGLCTTVGLESLEDHNINIYPNPTSEQMLNISNIYNSDVIHYYITSIKGEMLISGKFRTHAQVDVTLLSRGIYFLTLSNTESQLLIVKKVIRL
ncbi:MAG: T9SS type A sorting domain-containing protein [Brumimicrobium sp.]|nr:T9SS type A sorting domain-containing protein [Brumimicrobium sp.]